MSEYSDSARRSPDDALPPVTPPSAKFLIPLFVIPFCIVSSIVVVWALFSWLAQQGGDPQVDIDALSRDNAYRWQAAHNLADALRNPRHIALREDPAAAQKLAEILSAELAKPLPSDDASRQQDINLRTYLSRALGEFLVPDGLPVLVQAAAPIEGDADQVLHHLPVRLAALEALTVSLGNAREGKLTGDWQKAPALVEPSFMAAADFRNEDPNLLLLATQVRMRGAYGLGVIGTPAALDRLERLMVDPSPDVRYNAAAGLARNGDLRAVPLLCDMLDPNVTEGVTAETVTEAQPFKRAIIYQTALLSVEKLAALNTSGDLSQLSAALQKFIDAPEVADDLRFKAKEIRESLEKRPK
jgi:HEAT repeat protein